MTTLMSAFGSYAAARDQRLCPGRTVSLAMYLPGDADSACVACAAVASATDTIPIRSAVTAVTTIRMRRVSRKDYAVRISFSPLLRVRDSQSLWVSYLPSTPRLPLSSNVHSMVQQFDRVTVRSNASMPSLYRAAPTIKRHVEQMFGDIGICR